MDHRRSAGLEEKNRMSPTPALGPLCGTPGAFAHSVDLLALARRQAVGV